MNRIAALLALTLIGCAPETFMLQRGDAISLERATDSTCAASAIAQWNEAIPRLGLTTSDRAEWAIVDVPQPAGKVGSFDPDQPEIQIDFDRAARRSWLCESAVLHELGHALGALDHLPDGLMQATARATCIDIAAIGAVCAAQPELCDGTERPTCEGGITR